MERTVRAALIQAVGEVPGVLDTPAPALVATGMEGQVQKLEVRFWVDERASDVDVVKTAVIVAIQQALAELAGEGE